ncbi:MAG TPA: hypothetical protein PK537_07845 [Candidatus Limiplasma sp.]|nr:hypothetical protein [Candidatus Limiplasma sp.]
MKHKLLVLALLIIALLAFCTLSSAATDPIVCTMEVSPSALSEPGDVTVTITVSNSGDTDMTDPLTLFDPTSQVVTDFGDSGSVTLKAGEVQTWTGTWSVNQRTLENGQIVFFVKYKLENDDGTTTSKSQPIRGTIEQSDYTAKIAVTRTITPLTAREGQTVSVIYNIVNEGTVSLTNLKLAENKDILADTLNITDELKEGETAQFELPVVMGTKDLTSKATITYTIADGTEEQTYDVEEQVITYGEPAVIATLSSDAKGVMMNGTIKLTLELDNTGNVDYTDVRVTDPTLGDVFTNQTLPAGEKLTLDKEITLTQTTDFTFEISAIDKTGTEVIFESNTLSLIAVDPDKALSLTLTLTSDKTEVYSTDEVVKFTVTVLNDSEVDATDVVLSQAGTEICTFTSIPAGESRTFSRDVTLSMAGKYQFTAEGKDSLENTMTFESNVLQIAFLEPTPAPVTPNPNITATPEPTFVKATYPKASDPDIAALPKLIRIFFYPLMIAAAGLLVVALVILLIATKKRTALKKASEKAVDHLERSNHRDYVVPADEQTPPEDTTQPEAQAEETETEEKSEDEYLSEDELPHMKYVRNAYQIAGRENTANENPKDEFEQTPGQDDQEPWDVEPNYQTKDDDAPFRRRTSRVSPFAKKNDQDSQQDKSADHDDNP